MTDPQVPPWMTGADRFRKWWMAYLALCLPGAVLLLSGFGSWIFSLSLLVYVVLLVQAYRVQRDLRAAGLSRVGAWVVPVVPLLPAYASRSFEPPLTNGKVLLIVLGSLLVPLGVQAAIRKARRATARAASA